MILESKEIDPYILYTENTGKNLSKSVKNTCTISEIIGYLTLPRAMADLQSKIAGLEGQVYILCWL